MNARLRSFNDLVDRVLIGDRVRLEHQPVRKAFLSTPDLLVDLLKDHRLDLERGDRERGVVGRDVLKAHVLEELSCVLTDVRIGGHEREVSI